MYLSLKSITMSSIITTNKDDHVPLPGFRFHPTDEELVAFYLRRKVEKRPISIELIKQADIYKYDPWDLPSNGVFTQYLVDGISECNNGGEKERYFYCKRGRKYKNSIRPNRVTASGFWKATGIDRPIYSSRGDGRQCIGLKKSLVYYRGSAGKGTKTEWMMHEFRLPPTHDKRMDATQEAEVWTLCRILKRNVGSRKCVPDGREMATKRNNISNPAFYGSSSVESCDQNSYICFSNAPQNGHDQNNLYAEHNQSIGRNEDEFPGDEAPLSYNDLLRHADWEDLRSVVDYAAPTTNPLYM